MTGKERDNPMAKSPAASSATPAAKKPAAKKPAAARKPRAAKAPEAAAAAPAADSKAKFTKALEEARTSAMAFGKDAQGKAEAYREKLAASGGEWVEEAKVMGSQAKERAAELAAEGKTKASDAIANIGKIVADNAGQIDEKLGVKYGDYARTAARTMQETAAKIEAKDLNELGDDAKEFVRKSPGLAIGIAAVGGFLLARLFKGSSND